MKINEYYKIYELIEDLYNNKFMSIAKACAVGQISRNHYYTLCAVISKPSVASKEYKKSDSTQATFIDSPNSHIKKMTSNDTKNLSQNKIPLIQSSFCNQNEIKLTSITIY